MHGAPAFPALELAMFFALLIGIFAAVRQHRRGGESHDEMSTLFLWHIAGWSVIVGVAAVMDGVPVIAAFIFSLFLVLIASLPIFLPTYFLVRYVLRKCADH